MVCEREQRWPWWGTSFFFFNDTATTEIYTLSLHDALPIFSMGLGYWYGMPKEGSGGGNGGGDKKEPAAKDSGEIGRAHV